MKKIAIVGCGNIGSRHLQGVAKLGEDIKIQVVEPDDKSRAVAEDRISELDANKDTVEIEWLKNITDLDGDADLTIVATTSKGRAEIIDKLLCKGHKRFLVEKMVCQSSKEFEHLLNAFDENEAKGWVNCTRRYYPFYITIAGFKNEAPVFFNATAGNLGLGCNAIHFLDLFISLTEDNRVKLSGDNLSPRLFPNKRGEQFLEFAGTITAKTDTGSFASITFHPYNDAPPIINIITKDSRVFVDEGGKKALLAVKAHNWQWQSFEFKELYSSDVTTDIAKAILEEDACKLPTLENSYHIHKELFRIFNRHIFFITGKDVAVCPIT